MPNLKRAPGATPAKAKRRGQRRTRRRRSGWLTTMKIVFLLQRRRRRRRRREKSSPSPRQIALVVVSAGLAILVIRVASQRIRSRGAATPAAAQDAAPQPPTTPTPSNDAVTATESPLTERVQSEMSRHDDAPTHAAGGD